MFDQKNSEMVDLKKYAKVVSSQMSASTRKESAFSNGSALGSSDASSDPEQAEDAEEEAIIPQPSPIKFKFGDKFTKKPI